MKKLLTTLAAAIGLAASAFAATINLSTVTADTTLNDGDVAIGTLVGNNKVSIADGATVTLAYVTINGVDNSSYSWAGITCDGDATIILEGANTLKGFFEDYPGIHVPENNTLTIRGTGSLDASSNGNAAGIGGGRLVDCGNIVIKGGTINANGGSSAAGIGSGDMANCGDIVIEGGTINANGNYGAAGIGCGSRSDCGDVIIKGGTINAMGGAYAAGIGGGRGATCGDITITKDVTSVTVTSSSLANSIGAGYDGSCGTVTIGGVVGAITESPYTYYGEKIDLSTLSGNITIPDGRTLTGTLGGNYKVSIADGATVTLRDMNINGVNNSSYKWAGITCEGDATIILEGANTVKGFYENYPGIYVPANKTLTIKGSGSLNARSNGYGAGIGAAYAQTGSCGNIIIEGGSIVAVGGSMGAAGIGSCYGSSCGNISITGGTVVSTGGAAAAGIGCGAEGQCGNITIAKTVERVTATGGAADYGYGAGKSIGLDGSTSGTCGTVTIGGVVTGSIAESPYTYPENIVDLSGLSGAYTATDGDTLRGETEYAVTIPGGATVTVNGVSITGAAGGTVLPAPAFSADGKAATTEFTQGASGKWTLTAFAELGNDALGKDVTDGQIKVYRADTVAGLDSASPMTSGVEVKGKKSAVMTTIEVTPPTAAPAQFFRVKFGE